MMGAAVKPLSLEIAGSEKGLSHRFPGLFLSHGNIRM
jgi:hypothetical protein